MFIEIYDVIKLKRYRTRPTTAAASDQRSRTALALVPLAWQEHPIQAMPPFNWDLCDSMATLALRGTLKKQGAHGLGSHHQLFEATRRRFRAAHALTAYCGARLHKRSNAKSSE